MVVKTRVKEGRNESSEELKENGGGEEDMGLPISWAGRKRALGLTTPA